MKSRLLLLPTLFLVSLFPFAARAGSVAPSEGEALLNDLLRWPGSYGQICDAFPVPSPIPLPAFRIQTEGEASFSQKNLALMKEKRAVLVPVVRKRLLGVDFTRHEKEQPKDPSVVGEVESRPWGTDPTLFSTLLLQVVRETKALEALPELIEVEARLHDLLAEIAKNPATPPPVMDGFMGCGLFPARQAQEPENAPEKDEATVERERNLFLAEAAHRDLLAVMGALLRFAGYEPILNSKLEADYGKGLRKLYEKNEDLHAYKSKQDIPEEEREWIGFDQLHRLPHYKWEHVAIPYSEALRNQMRIWVGDYLKTKSGKP